MNNLTSRALELQRLAHELIYLGVDGEPIYSDTYCYGEVYEEALLREAHEIIGSWDNTSLSSGQAEIIEELRNIEENPYPYEVIE